MDFRINYVFLDENFYYQPSNNGWCSEWNIDIETGSHGDEVNVDVSIKYDGKRFHCLIHNEKWIRLKQEISRKVKRKSHVKKSFKSLSMIVKKLEEYCNASSFSFDEIDYRYEQGTHFVAFYVDGDHSIFFVIKYINRELVTLRVGDGDPSRYIEPLLVDITGYFTNEQSLVNQFARKSKHRLRLLF